MRLKPVGEQVVVVMGASSGIGRLTALHFAERGARVVVTGQRVSPRLLGALLELWPSLKRTATFGVALGALAILRGRSQGGEGAR